MSTDWSLLLEDSKSVENVKVVCKDGVVFSHKLVIASSGEFMKNLLNDVPVGDEITIYLPDCNEDTLLNSLNSIVIPDPKRTVNVFDIASSSHQELQLKLEPEIIKTEGIRDLVVKKKWRTLLDMFPRVFRNILQLCSNKLKTQNNRAD